MQGEVKMIPANNSTDIKDPYFSAEYNGHEIPEHEAHLYHVAIEPRAFKSVGATPERLSKSKVQKYTVDAFKATEKAQGFSGLVVHILHNPEAKPTEGGSATPTLTYVSGIGEAKAELLKANGVASLSKLASLTDQEIQNLEAVDGLTATEVAQWVEDAKTLLPS